MSDQKERQAARALAQFLKAGRSRREQQERLGVIRAQAKFLKAGGSRRDPGSPLMKFLEPRKVDILLRTWEKQFQAGDTVALFKAVHLCLRAGVAPSWVRQAFDEGLKNVIERDAVSWDEAFGGPYRKGAQIKSVKRRRKLLLPVYEEVMRLHVEEKRPIDLWTFAAAGKKFGIGHTLAGELYKEVINARVPI